MTSPGQPDQQERAANQCDEQNGKRHCCHACPLPLVSLNGQPIDLSAPKFGGHVSGW